MNKGMRKTILITAILAIILIIVNIFVFTLDGFVRDLVDDLYLKDLDINITVNEDGSIWVEETHSAKFNGKDDDWYNYFKVISTDSYRHIDFSTFKASVDDKEYPLADIQIDLDDVFSNDRFDNIGNSYYCDRNNGTEIGVIMPAFERGEKEIKFSYRLTNIIKKSDDIAYLYYKYVSDDNPLRIKKFSAKVHFPASSKDNLRTWLHVSDVKSNVDIVSDHCIEIEAKDIPKNTFIETRLTFDRDNFTFYDNDSVSFDEILDEEQDWYADHEAKVKRQMMFVALDVCLGILVLGICLAFSIKDFVGRKRKTILNTPIYLHEPPTDYTMEESMAIFYYYDNDESDVWWSDVISGTIMNLVRKKYLSVIAGEKKKSAVITIANNNRDELKPYENVVMDLLEDASIGGVIAMDEFEKWCQRNYIKVDKKLKEYKEFCNARAYSDRMYHVANPKPRPTGLIVAIIGICLSFAVMFAFNPFYVCNIMVGVAGIVMYLLDRLRSTPLNKGGERKYLELKAFEKFMLDFSNFDEKTLPELSLWEEYMIWATGMGIADQVSKQLSIKYPEFRSYYEGDIYAGDLMYWYLFSPRLSFNIGYISRSMHNTINSVNALKIADTAGKHFSGGSTGGGFGGGGFSGGGGGFGGGSMGGR